MKTKTMFAAWLRALRDRLAMTQPELGSLLGIQVGAISRWENGREIPSTPNVLLLMALATPDECMALIEKGAERLDDTMKADAGNNLEIVLCQECGLELRVRDFTTNGWAAPPLIRHASDPYAVKMCPQCSS